MWIGEAWGALWRGMGCTVAWHCGVASHVQRTTWLLSSTLGAVESVATVADGATLGAAFDATLGATLDVAADVPASSDATALAFLASALGGLLLGAQLAPSGAAG